MREGLAREFPDARRASAWARDRVAGGPTLWKEPVVWATISGIGAGFLVGAAAQAVVSLANEALQALRSPQPFTLVPLVTIPGTAAAAAVALSVGGAFALALYVAYLLLGVALRIPGMMFACERSGGVLPFPGPDQCTALGFLASLWPQLIGLGLGILVARTLATRGDGINSSLRVAGSLALAVFVVSQAWTASIAQGGYAVPNDALTSGLTVAAAMIAAAVAAGVIAAHVPAGIRSASLVAFFWLLPWFAGQLPYALRTLPEPIAAENVAPIALGLAIQPLAAAFLVLSAVVTSRARFIPRDSA
jgi:hypothetical protein